jgi:hypothetical protein
MINKQSDVLSYIRKVIKDLSVVKYVGIYPNWNEVTHDNMPAVLIRDGNEEVDEDFERNGLYDYDYFPEIHLYQLNDKLRFDNLTVQASICDAIINDPTLGGAALCTEILSVDKGDYNTEETNTSAFIGPEANMRVITLRIKLSTVR